MYKKSSQSGFSLIELIVSLGVFSVVVTTAVGALLALVSANDELQDEQNVMANLSFALDSMTREIRTGTNYFCDSWPNRTDTTNMFNNETNLDDLLDGDPLGPTNDCANGSSEAVHGLAFDEGGNSISGVGTDRIVYFYDGNPASDTYGQILRRVGAGDAVSIVSSNLFIHEADFFVTGSTPQSEGAGNYYDQASVTIYIAASDSETTPPEEQFYVQTTVTQRTLDI
jgi:prepilin-type N-terminal cleavage/methylation domain-containing protein